MTALRGKAALESGLARVQGADGIAGAGFLVAADVVCTCAHVVADALGLPRDTVTAPPGTLRVEFPLARDAEGNVPARRARVVSWQPLRRDDGGDVALLRLDAPVPAVRPVPLVDGTSVWGHSFRAYGFPGGGDHGLWAAGTLRGVQGAGWVQMDTGPGAPRVTNGYSGAAVWDDVQGGVVGMAVAAGRGDLAGTAFLVPSAALVDEEVLRPTCPFRGLDVFEEEDGAFFHGREDDTGRLLASVTARPLTVVVGPSGCGKSSLIRAGLLPRVRSDGTGVTVLRPVPGTPPETLLAHALAPVLEPGGGEVDRIGEAGRLARMLGGGSGDRPGPGEPAGADGGRTPPAVAALRASLEERAGRAGHLIVVDQLEEYAGAEPAAARTLLHLLLALTEGAGPGPGRGVRVVATARQESLDVLLTSRTSRSLSDAVLFLAPLDAENLHRAVTGPVDAVPGLWLEPGLAERVVEDAADEPGRMPLVEFTLTRLWERRERSMLTHAAYDDLGGVAGTLVGYADDAYRTHVPVADEGPARRLFVQLARPDDRGGYIRRAVPAARLDPAAAALARRLARGKLVVLGETAEGTEIVDLAHEALTRLWPRLRTWLDDSRDFRQWQEQLRTDMARWEEKGRETGALQRGRTLAEGEEWLQRLPEDVTADERAYIEAGRRYARRTVRRLLAGGALLTVLLLVAAALGAVAWDTGGKLRTQLRTLASRALAEESGSRQARQPATAVQWALAAWHADRTTPQAREALLAQYARARYVRGLHSGLWRGRVQDLAATPDGRTLAVRSKPDGKDPYEVSVVTGVLEGAPRHHTLDGVPATQQRDAISPDGRHYAAAMPDGTVWLWRLEGRGGRPTRLGGRLTGGRDRVDAGLAFSADGSRLLRWLDIHTPGDPAVEPRAFLGVWDLEDRKPLPVADTVVSTAGDQTVRFGRDAGTVQVTTTDSDDAGTPDGTVLRDLGTGRVLRSLPADGAFGDWPGSDATGAYAFDTTENADFGYADVTLGRRDTNETYATRLPMDDEPGYQGPTLTVVARGEGDGRTVLSPVGDTLVVADAPAVPRPDSSENDEVSLLSPDGGRSARLAQHEVRVVDLVRGGTTAAGLPAGLDPDVSSLVWTQDGEYLVLVQEGGSHLYVYDADALSDPTDVSPGEGLTTAGERELTGTVEPLPDGDVVALTRSGGLLRVDPERGVRTGEPLTVDPSPRGTVFPPVRSRVVSRPGHPDQVVVVTPDDADEGTVRIWDLRARTRTSTLKGDEVGSAFDGDDADNLVFSPDGRYLAVAHSDGRVHRWDVGKSTPVGTPVPAPGGDDVLAVTNGGMVITTEGGTGYGLWDLDGVRVGTIPSSPYSTAVLRGSRLVVEDKGRRTAFALDPDIWFRHLCARVGRAFTAGEREELPPGTPSEPPCAGA
ncbi:trypsin-like peptidase domain-containing protein [Streptomyces sp. NPDC101213]|uniref:nSTAND1 domain-containing NTPase n=1 Tax=Streptomyces sp. NPDC101213 TaxID=3366130 RepID=UPI003819E18B